MQQWTMSLPYTLEAEWHMRDHAGFSVQADETTEQGRMRCARGLAQAEMWARKNGMTFEWEDDWEIGSHVREYDGYEREPDTCETCIASDADGKVVASLGCVDDATAEYRRVVEAELASEVLSRQRNERAALEGCPELRALVDYSEAKR